jgi:tetratricopeptide (TPR) repeat protein
MKAIAKAFHALLRNRSTTEMTAALVVGVLGIGVAHAGLYNNDYYASKISREGLTLIQSVELYHLGPAEQNLHAKRYRAAAGEIDFMLRAFPNHPKALQLMVNLCAQWKSPVCAVQLGEKFEKAIAVNPNAPTTYVVLGNLHQSIGQFANAIESYKRALQLDADSVNAEYNLGLAYLETKQFDLANEHAQRAYELGAPLPGLRDKLMKAGKWKPLDRAQASDFANPPAPEPASAKDAPQPGATK